MATVDTSMSANTQQFADDEIVDNYGAGPDDGVPMGLGGEKGKQSEPANSTLEADIVSNTKQEKKPLSGDDIPPDNAAAGGEPDPVQDTAGDDDTAKAESKVDEPEAPEFSASLLQMAGFSSAEDAKKFGFKDPESLLAAVQLQNRVFTQPAKASRTSYVETPKTPEPPPTKIPAELPPQGDDLAFKPFKVANPEIFDDELLKLIDAQNQHNAAQFSQLASRLRAEDQPSPLLRRAEQFEQVIQELGPEWEAEFGKGGIDGFTGRTDAESVMAAKNRVDTFHAANFVQQLNAENRGKPMTIQEEVNRALMLRYPEKFKQHTLGQQKTKADARRGTQASRPTARTTPPGTRNARLLSNLQGKYPGVDFSGGSGSDVPEGDI